jgi:hypothetical protein
MIQLEIQKEDDKATVAAILVMNGYTVRKVKVADGKGGRGKFVLQAWKDEGEKKDAGV